MVEFIASNMFARIAALLLLFIIVLGVVYLASNTVVQRSSVRKELDKLGLDGTGRTQRDRLAQSKEGAWFAILDKIEKSGLNLADTRSDELRKKLVAAGYTSEAAPKLFTLSRLVLIIALPLLLFFALSVSESEMGIFKMYMLLVGFALLGAYLPSLVVSAKADRREETIRKGFPDCLDLMLVCVEAGLGLESAMDRVSREMVRSHPLISELLSIATMQMRAGATRADALRKLGDLSGVDEIRSFSTLLIQSDKMGTSVADTLRVYAAEMREKRRLRAEEKAHRLPVLISIPLVVCMLPTMIGVLMVPGIVRAVRTLLPALSGG